MRIARLCLSICLVVLAAGPIASAHAQSGSPPTLTADGLARVKPAPGDRNSETSIRTAVDAALKRALPMAVSAARAHAADLAAAAGVQLGSLLSVSDAPTSGFPFYYQPQFGTFGDGRFCGNVRRFKTIVRKDGSRRRVALKGTRRVCRVPSSVTASVALTYAISG